MNQKAVILLSGGMDSLTCMAIARDAGFTLLPISFDYGQKHRSELQAAATIAKEFDAKHKIIQCHDIGAMGGSSLTDESMDVSNYDSSDEIPSSYVPARNIIFLSIALGYAEVMNADSIFIGVSSVDYSGYPDCRPEFIDAFAHMARVGTKRGVENNSIRFKTPLINLSKAETIAKGIELGVDYRISVTCYRANENGEACGQCDSCILRQKGFSELGIEEQTRYAN